MRTWSYVTLLAPLLVLASYLSSVNRTLVGGEESVVFVSRVKVGSTTSRLPRAVLCDKISVGEV